MKSKKIISLIVSAGMMVGTIGSTAPAMLAHAETMNSVNVYAQSVVSSFPRAVVKVQSKVMNGNKEVGIVNAYEMAIVKSQSNGVANVVTQNGLTGTIDLSNLIMVNSGMNDKLVSMNKNGHVANVTTVLNVRSNATVQSSIKAQLTNNTNFKIIGQKGDWLKINVGNETGFVFNEFTSEGHSNVVGRVITGNEINSMATAQGSTYGSVQNNNVATSSATTNSSAKVSESNGSKTVTTGITTSKTTVKSNTENKATKTSSSVKETSSKPTSSSKVEHKIVEHNTPVNTQGQDSNRRQTQSENNNQANQTAPTKGQSQVKTGYTYMPQLSQEVFNGINQLRKQAGQKALEYSSSDNSQAMSLALQMAKAGNADHSYNEMGAMCSEGNSNYIVNMFKNSPEHYSQLTQSTIDKGSVAVYRNNKTGLYFTAVQFTIANATNNTWHNM